MDKKKLAAAMAAVMTYIKTGEEAQAYQAQEPEATQVVQQIIGQNNIWGISGRQNQMQANTMMQLRMFK